VQNKKYILPINLRKISYKLLYKIWQNIVKYDIIYLC
jgi:hypothetical protein